MKNTVKLFALVAFKLGHLDVQKLMSVMPESKQADATLQAKQAEIQKEMTSMQETYQKLIQEYQANEKTYTDIIRANKEQEIRSLGERIQSFQSVAEQQMRETYDKLMGEIMDKIQKAAQEVGKENGFTYIFTMNALLYAADNSEDVLPLIKKKLGIQ